MGLAQAVIVGPMAVTFIMKAPVRLLCAVAVVLGAPLAMATEITEITAEDYYGFKYFQRALEFPQVAELKTRDKQVRIVARDMGWKSTRLKAALTKVDSLGGNPTELGAAAIKAGFEDSRVKGRVIELQFDDTEPKHVVAYVRLRGSKSDDAVKDASAVANAVIANAPFVSTASLCLIHPKAPDTNKTCVWSAKIGRSSMERIEKKRIEAYGQRLYARMFEDVKALGPY